MSKANKRMSHVFNEMVVKPGRGIDTAELHFIGGGVSATFFCAQQAHHAAHAINNHDRMVDEIAELREALGLIVYADEMINEGVNAHGGMSMMIGSIANARELLDKHK